MTDTVDSGTSNTYKNDNPRRLSLSSSAFSNCAVGSPEYGYWWVHELSRTAGSTANGNTPLSSYDTTGPTAPFTTPTPRQRPRLELRLNGTYTYNYVERLGHRNPANLNVKNSTRSSKTPLFGTTPRTPRRAAQIRSSSTTPLVGCSPSPPRPTG